MFWPSLIIAICGAIFLRLEMKRRNIRCFWEERRGQDDLEEAKNQTKPLMDYPSKPLVICHYNNDNNHVDSKLTGCKPGNSQSYISSSLSCLDRISTGQCAPGGQQRPSLTYGRILSSRSADALKNKQVSQSEIDLKQVIAKANQGGGSKSAFCTDIKIKIDSPSSTGSRVTGIETPVWWKVWCVTQEWKPEWQVQWQCISTGHSSCTLLELLNALGHTGSLLGQWCRAIVNIYHNQTSFESAVPGGLVCWKSINVFKLTNGILLHTEN